MKSFQLFLIVSCLFFSACRSSKVQLICGISEHSQIGINHLQPLVEAMENYKSDNGRYPKTGLDLIPKYIDRIPVFESDGLGNGENLNVLKYEITGTSRAYFSEDGSYFSETFYPAEDRICLIGRNNICEYTSISKKWGCYQH